MFKGIKSFIDWIASGTDRELQRIRESRKYTSYWLSVVINWVMHIYLMVTAPEWSDSFAVIVEAVENHAIFYGIYAGANAIQKSGAAKTVIHANKNKTTNNEDESDPETMPL